MFEKLRNYVRILVGQAVLELSIKTILHVLISNSRTAGSIKILKVICWQIFFQKSIDDFEIACNAQFWFRVQLPLNTDLKNVKLNFIKDVFDGPGEGTQIIV